MNKLDKYYLPKNGNTESIINLNLESQFGRIELNRFLKKYKISNFWSGKFFIKRLINKIFKYKLKQKNNWNTSFWNSIEINVVNSIVTFNENFHMNDFLSQIKKRRMKDILNYKELINSDIDMGYPLFITGECLNLVSSSKIVNNQLFMLDGSRRLIASMLNNTKNIKIIIISNKS